jgi:cytochrome c-type biogenesis protein
VELSLATAMFAGLVSFASPCVLPVVPAYLGQLGITAAAVPSRWRALRHAIAFVTGFGAVFVLLGLTAYAFRPLFDLAIVRIAGGALLVLLGLNLMGVLRLGTLGRSWRPFERFGRAPLGGAAARNPIAAFALGAIFAVGWTPCIGPTLAAILGLSLQLGAAPQVVALLVGYSVGLAIPFVALAVLLDRAEPLTRPLLRHGRAVEIVGGALVVIIGLAIAFDWLSLLAAQLRFLWPNV